MPLTVGARPDDNRPPNDERLSRQALTRASAGRSTTASNGM